MYGSPQFEEMRAKCIGQELSWEVPAAKWEQVLLDLQAGRKPQVRQWTLCHLSIMGVAGARMRAESSVLAFAS